jgi:hypothetical protein
VNSFERLNKPTVVLTVLGLVLMVNVFLFYRYQATFQGSEDGAPEDNDSEDVKSSTKPSEGEYLGEVGRIQDASVDALVSSNDKLFRYDTLTARDIEDLESNQLRLADYRDQAQSLDAPEEYEGPHETFSEGISELYEASKIAYRLAAEPVSATQADFRLYTDHVDSATALLQQSNEALGQDYKTTKGLKLPVGSL